MGCLHKDYSYQRRCNGCGRMVKGAISKSDIAFYVIVSALGGMAASLLVIFIF